jgi:hypothetical protein
LRTLREIVLVFRIPNPDLFSKTISNKSSYRWFVKK